MYYPLKIHIKDSIELCPIELAGKGLRMQESFCNTFKDLIDDAINAIISTADFQPYAIFGYSMGSLLAYEVALKLYGKLRISPKMIFFAASSPLHVPSDRKNLYGLDDKMFIQRLIDFGGLASEVVECPELLEFFLPIIRADFKLIHDYNITKPKPALPVDFTVMYSDEDNKDNNIGEWDKYTMKTCEYYRFPDGHFFINQHYEEIADIINNKL